MIVNIFSVVINHEGQYSIWPSDREMPGGWQKEGKVGDKNDCLSYINKVWTDIRPQSIKRKTGFFPLPDVPPLIQCAGEVAQTEGMVTQDSEGFRNFRSVRAIGGMSEKIRGMIAQAGVMSEKIVGMPAQTGEMPEKIG